MGSSCCGEWVHRFSSCRMWASLAGPEACGFVVANQRSNLIRFTGRWSLNHWTTREAPVCLELSSGDSNTPSRKRTTVQNALCMCVKSLQSCLTLCNPMDCSLPGPSVHESLQARILEWVAVPSSRDSSQPRDLTCVSSICCISRLVLYHWPFLESPKMHHGRPLGNLVLYLRSRL